MKIYINPKYEHLRAFVCSLPAVMDTEGTYIYGGRRNLIKRFDAPDGTCLNVKRFQQPKGINRIVYSTGLRAPKGWRAFTYPTRLLEHGIETPEAVAYIEERNALGLLGQSYFVSLQCPYTHLLYELGDAPEGTYEDIAVALAVLQARMHNAGILHRDFSPGNVLWERVDGEYRFSIVDINRMHFGSVSMKAGCANFARLWGPKRFIQIAVREYARLRQFDPDICERIALQARARFWTRYQRKREMEFKLEL